MDITADLRPLWHWNVKQAFVYVTAEVGPTPADSDDSSAAAPGAAETKNPATPAPATATQAILWSRIVRSKADAHIVRTVAFGRDGRTLVTGGYEKAVRVWDLGGAGPSSSAAAAASTPRDAFTAPDKVRHVAYTADGGLLMTTYMDAAGVG